MHSDLIMKKIVVLPQLELNMESVLLVRWLVKPGDLVAVEQPILEVETQKAVTRVSCPYSGYVRRLCVAEGDTISEKTELCILTDMADEAFGDSSSVTAAVDRTRSEDSEMTGAVVDKSGGIKAAPAARKLARELGLELASVPGTGPGARVTVADVTNANCARKDAGPLEGTWKEVTPARAALIAQMNKSLAEIPQIHIARQLEVRPLLMKSDGITFTHRLTHAVALTLIKHPALRTICDRNRVKIEPVSVAIAMDTAQGLVAPALRNPHEMSLPQIVAATNDFRTRAAARTLKHDELVNAPFAISNLGSLDVDFFSAFVFHGQTAVLAVGRATAHEAGARKAWFNLAVDHRIVDGAEAARFLQTLQTEILKS